MTDAPKIQPPRPRPTVTISYSFTLFDDGADVGYAALMADAIFEHLAQGPSELDEWDYSIDDFQVDEYRPARDDDHAIRPHVFTTDGYVHAHDLGNVACTTCGHKNADGPHIIEGGPTDRAMKGDDE